MHARAPFVRTGALLLGSLVFPMALTGCGGGGGGGSHAPPIPANLVATVNGTDVDLDWTASTGATEYRVYYDLVPGVVRSDPTSLGSVPTPGAVLTGQPS